jgi:hypothetical protein
MSGANGYMATTRTVRQHVSQFGLKELDKRTLTILLDQVSEDIQKHMVLADQFKEKDPESFNSLMAEIREARILKSNIIQAREAA